MRKPGLCLLLLLATGCRGPASATGSKDGSAGSAGAGADGSAGSAGAAGSVGAEGSAEGGAAQADATQAPPLLGIHDVELPEGAWGSAPTLAAGLGGPILGWIGQGLAGDPALKLTRLRPGVAGPAFSPVEEVASNPRILADWSDVPALAETPAGRLVAAWPEYHDDGRKGHGLRVTAAGDGGGFIPAWSPDDVRAGPETGFAGFAVNGEVLRMFWLDGREIGAGGAEGQGAGTMQLRTAVIDGEGKQAAPSRVLDRRTCECCSLGVGRVGDRPLVAYRDRSDAEVRDIFVTGLGLAPVPVASDGWTIAGCPVNGPGLIDGARIGHVAWFTGAGDQSRIWLASGTPEAGFGEATRVDLGAPAGRIATIADGEGGGILSWVELPTSVGGPARLLTRRVSAEGELGPAWLVAEIGSGHEWGVPRLAVLGDEVLWVYTDPRGAAPKLAALLAELPAL